MVPMLANALDLTRNHKRVRRVTLDVLLICLRDERHVKVLFVRVMDLLTRLVEHVSARVRLAQRL